MRHLDFDESLFTPSGSYGYAPYALETGSSTCTPQIQYVYLEYSIYWLLLLVIFVQFASSMGL